MTAVKMMFVRFLEALKLGGRPCGGSRFSPRLLP